MSDETIERLSAQLLDLGVKYGELSDKYCDRIVKTMELESELRRLKEAEAILTVLANTPPDEWRSKQHLHRELAPWRDNRHADAPSSVETLQ